MKVYSASCLRAIADGEVLVTGALGIYCDPPVFLWGGQGTAAIDGDIYLGLDDRGIGQVTGGAIGGSEQNIEFTLSGVEPEALELLDAGSVRSAPAKLYRMIFDSSGTICLDARIWKRGRCDDLAVIETIGDQATISLKLEGAARGLGRSGKRTRSDADQRTIDPLDGGFKHCSFAGSKSLFFGGKPSSATAG